MKDTTINIRSHASKKKAAIAIPLIGKIAFLVAGFFVLFVCFAFSQETTGANKIFTEKKDSVFLVNQAIFLDESKIGNIELFRRLETAMDKKVLNQYIPLANGTAFLVNKDGYFITAFHVIKYLDANSKYNSATWSFEDWISKNAIPGYLTKAELRAVFREYIRFIKNAPIVISLKSADKKDYVAQVIAQNDNLDLALLKADLDVELTPLIVTDKNEIKVGDSVITIGYPLQFIMDSFLDDFKPTLTNGVISAIREDKWDLQHTASLNGGNSGGPLLNMSGDLLGVNVGLITKANNIYFSTNAKKIITWLKDIGKANILADADR